MSLPIASSGKSEASLHRCLISSRRRGTPPRHLTPQSSQSPTTCALSPGKILRVEILRRGSNWGGSSRNPIALSYFLHLTESKKERGGPSQLLIETNDALLKVVRASFTSDPYFDFLTLLPHH